MAKVALEFQLPAHGADMWPERLAEALPLREENACQSIRRYYDSFDWRLYEAGWLLELETADARPKLHLYAMDGDEVLTCPCETDPGFAEGLPKPLRKRIAPLLDMRVLLPRVEIRSQRVGYRLPDDDGKPVLRVTLDEARVVDGEGGEQRLGARVRLWPVKGGAKALKRAASALQSHGFEAETEPLLERALAALGRRPKDYSSRLTLRLDGQMRADEALKSILKVLLASMEANEAGMVQRLDTEFLHDFRVAVRRTRSALGQVTGVLPQRVADRFSRGFAWLGQITSEARDLDVYLLHFGQYRASLPVSIRDDLGPLYGFIGLRRDRAYAELVKHLASAKYRRLLSSWRAFLDEPVPDAPVVSRASRPIKEVADRRIWRVYRRVLREGRAVTSKTPAADLHQLRKSCKKLRYLMEFFQSLYPEGDIKGLINSLKGLQENLGDFQDCAVQEETLRRFSEEMMASDSTPAATLLAMGVLIQQLGKRSRKARDEFADRFDSFDSSERRAAFKRLFKAGGKGDRG